MMMIDSRWNLTSYFSPRVKQYGQVITVCGTYVDTDVYVASRVSRTEPKKKNDDDNAEVIVGLLFADTDEQ